MRNSIMEVPFFVRSQEVRRKNTFEYYETAIIISGDGVGVGKIFHYVEGKCALHQRAYRIHITDKNVISKFFYYMKSTFLQYMAYGIDDEKVWDINREQTFCVSKRIHDITEYILDHLNSKTYRN